MKKIILLILTINASLLASAQYGEFSVTGGLSLMSAQYQSRKAPMGGGGSINLFAGKNHAIVSMGLGYDYNPRIEHYLLSRTGLQTLKTSIGAGGYAFLGNTTLSVTGEFLYLHSNVPSQDVIMYQNEWYRLQDIKGHGLGLQARLGLLIPFGSESNWGLKIQSTAGGLMKNTNSLKYQTTIQTCCGTTTRTMRREFFPNPVMMPRALFTFEIGIGFKFGSENKNDRWSSF